MDAKTKPSPIHDELKRMLLNKPSIPALTDEQQAELQRKIAILKSRLSPQALKQLESLRKQRAASNEL